MRVLALIAKLFSVSSSAASAVYDSNLLGLLEAEVDNTSDVLMTLSALELFYELAESPNGAKFLLKTTLLQRLTSMISIDVNSISAGETTMNPVRSGIIYLSMGMAISLLLPTRQKGNQRILIVDFYFNIYDAKNHE
ncbi:hypothetical protein ACLOJK_008559 [Asimina triloba]